ncbi:hypothetical protein RYX36_023125, partial [Vicia faba]
KFKWTRLTLNGSNPWLLSLSVPSSHSELTEKFPQHFWCFRRFLRYVASHFYRIQKGQDKKQLIHPEFKIGGQRNWIQVLSNSGIASVLVVALWVLTEGKDYCLNSKDSPLITAIIGGVIGHYCCYNGDTWSSEIGVLSDDRPRLIIIFKHVRKGTNGGVTKQDFQQLHVVEVLLDYHIFF